MQVHGPWRGCGCPVWSGGGGRRARAAASWARRLSLHCAPRARLPDSRLVQRKWEGSSGREGRATPLVSGSGPGPVSARLPPAQTVCCHLGRQDAATLTPSPGLSTAPLP